MTGPILCPVDLSHEASWRIALPEAAAQARLRGAELHLLAVVPDIGMSLISPRLPDGYETGLLAQALEALKTLAQAKVPPGIPHQCHIAHGHVAEEILRIADRLQAGLIVMASHRPDALRTLLVGSVADRIAHHAAQSVLIVREP